MGPIVSCRRVTKIYRQGVLAVPALQGVDLDIATGDFATISGPSGSGKTTLLNVIGGLDKPSAGQVSVDGVALATLDKNALSDIRLHKIGFVFQNYSLIPVLSAVENVEFILRLLDVPAAERQARAREMLREVGLEGLEDRRPARLSGGQQQRVAVARALASKPAIVLADEPTGNIDPATSIGIMKVLDRINRTGTTVVMATHDAAIVDSMRKRVIELEYGKVVRDQSRGVYGQAY